MSVGLVQMAPLMHIFIGGIGALNGFLFLLFGNLGRSTAWSGITFLIFQELEGFKLLAKLHQFLHGVFKWIEVMFDHALFDDIRHVEFKCGLEF